MPNSQNNLTTHIVKPLILNSEEVNKLLPQLNVQQLIQSLFLALANKKAVQPSQTLTPFPDDKGDYITYLGAMAEEGVFGAKLSPYLVTDSKPIITAWTNLMSMQTGQPLLWCDSGQLTIERTAGTTALAVDYLAPKQCTHLALIGTGNVGIAHLKHTINLRDWQTITLFAPELSEDKERQQKLKAIDSRIQLSDTADNCVNGADVIMLCTSSANPVISLNSVKSSALITSISTNAVNAHEVPVELLNRADVYCDYRQTTPESAGEMCLAIKQEGWDKSQIKGDLSELVARTCALPEYDKPVFFRSIGLGLEDVAMAYGIWQLANQ